MQKQFFSNSTIKFLKFSIFIMTILICFGTIFLIYGLKNKYDSLKLKKKVKLLLAYQKTMILYLLILITKGIYGLN